jgi:PTS system nitrogen regulatory IIA component
MVLVELTNYLTPEHLLVPLTAADKRAAIIKLTATLAYDEADHQRILEGILAREEMISTGIGHGVAVPHCRLAGEKVLRLAVGLADEPIEWGGFDDRPVELVFCLVGGRDDGGELSEVLGEISRLLADEDRRKTLAAVDDAAALLHVISGFYGQA